MTIKNLVGLHLIMWDPKMEKEQADAAGPVMHGEIIAASAGYLFIKQEVYRGHTFDTVKMADVHAHGTICDNPKSLIEDAINPFQEKAVSTLREAGFFNLPTEDDPDDTEEGFTKQQAHRACYWTFNGCPSHESNSVRDAVVKFLGGEPYAPHCASEWHRNARQCELWQASLLADTEDDSLWNEKGQPLPAPMGRFLNAKLDKKLFCNKDDIVNGFKLNDDNHREWLRDRNKTDAEEPAKAA